MGECEARVRPPCDEETGESVEFEAPSASTPFEERLLLCAVQEALQALPEKDRQIAEWRLFEELTEQEIAQRLGVSQRAVSQRLQRILTTLREQLGR